jgi:hypothetical protein
MASPGSIVGAIAEELGETAKQVVKQTAQVPKDVGQTALESLGGQQGKTQGSAVKTKPTPVKTSGERTPLDDFKSATDERTKKEVARRALAYLAGDQQAAREPSVWEQKQKEAGQKKEEGKEQKEAQRKAQLPFISTKPKRGNLFGVTQKKAGMETSRNVRSD